MYVCMSVCAHVHMCLHVYICACALSYRWLVVKDYIVLYMWPEDGQVGTVILYDKSFHIDIGTQDTGV